MHHTTCAITLLTLCMLTPTLATAQVVWSGDLEDGTLDAFRSKLNERVEGKSYINVVDDPVYEGQHAARIELHDDARWPNGLRRVELQHRPDDARTAEGATTFFAWSFYIPESFPTDPGQQIGYWESRNSYRQMMAFEVKGTTMVFVTRQPNNTIQWEAPGVVTPGQWHRIAMRVTWSKDPNIGEVDLWFDGTQVVTAGKAKTLNDDNPHFVQFGILRGDQDFDDVPVIVIDDAVEGNSLADVRPNLPEPPMEPEPDMGQPLQDMDTPAVDMPADMHSIDPRDMSAPIAPDMPQAADMTSPPTKDMMTSGDMKAPEQIKEPVPYDHTGEESEGGCTQSPSPTPHSWPFVALFGLLFWQQTRRR